MDRGSKRSGPHNDRGRPPKRTPPPPATGQESRYLDEQAMRGATLTFKLSDGRELRGVVAEHDCDAIHVTGSDGTGFVLRKAEIRYVVDGE
jgi:hypothetical protein